MMRIVVCLGAMSLAPSAGCSKPAKTGIVPGFAPTATPALQAAGPAALQVSADNLLKATKNVVEILDTVQDDASARAAAPQLRRAALELRSAATQHKSTIASLSVSGQQAEIVKIMQSYGEKADQPEYKIQDAIERVALGPQGNLLRAEIGSILDALIEGEGSGGKANLQRWIDRKKLRGS